MGANYPSALKRLWTWAKDALSDGQTVSFELSEEAFGSTKKRAIFVSDIHAVCSGGEMLGSVICIYMNCLNDYVQKHKMANLIAFVDPSTIGALGCGNVAQRSRALALRFKDARKGQCFLMPKHWTLTVANPEAEIVYHMDPLKLRIANGEWVEVVDNAIKFYKEDQKKAVKKEIVWENMAGVPVQAGTKDCGLFVMRYMKKIVQDKDLDFANKWMRRSNLAYTQDDISEIKIEFAKYFMKRYAS
ncbi:uncharacterized protein LOC108197904 [Daucus carota subsp. sativus]|uniref:uncharacterized protein LOC108197904 n=1 Tax=Daucus carota subsp. sativus TaxID=79200 RepID=UPI003082A1BC